MKRRSYWLGILWIASIALVACTGPFAKPSPLPETKNVTLAMGFIPNVQFTPVYVAIEKGYFGAEGIEVELDYGVENDLFTLVGTDEMQFVIGSGEQVILARSHGSLKPLDSPHDLLGMDVGLPGLYGANYIGWQALIDAARIDPAGVNLISIGYTQVESLATGQVDAAVVYAMNAPVQLRQQGYEVNLLHVADYIDFVSNGLISNEKTIAEQPELVRGMVRALMRGLDDTLADPDAAFEICRKHVPEIDDETAPLQRAVLEESLDFWRADALGRSDPEAWAASAAFMRQIGQIDAEIDPSTLFTNDFVPE
jgi:NitT/TauT family transport system substrate-binding protein